MDIFSSGGDERHMNGRGVTYIRAKTATSDTNTLILHQIQSPVAHRKSFLEVAEIDNGNINKKIPEE